MRLYLKFDRKYVKIIAVIFLEFFMKIVILDRSTLGDDTPLGEIERHGELVCYDSTAPDQVSERIRGADVVIVNKVKMPREVITSSDTLKLICVFATGYDNIDVAAAREKGVGV